MPVNIDEVSAEVTAPRRGGESDQRTEPEPHSPSETRRQREQIERMKQRAARVCAD